MKTRSLPHRAARSALLGTLLATAALITTARAESVTLRDGKLLLMANEASGTLVTTNFALSPTIDVFTNATFTVGKGKPRALQPGEILSSDGLLTKPNGYVGPVDDHYAMVKGRLYLVEDGVAEVVTANVRSATGATATPDGWITTAGGKRARILDGQWFKLDGSPIATRDSITLTEGKVMVQADGSLLTIAPGRTFMMNDGTKVSGNGTYTKRDGTIVKLVEGEVVVIQGVARRRL